jgi:murein L,D-transpeptidase YcbB/YkuD
LQQRPGAKNALGGIKLELPNRFDVYLHDTPARNLFGRAERNFSHGCIRVENIPALAQHLLEHDGLAVPAAAASGNTIGVPLRRPVPVYLLYITAFVDEQGVMNFRRDPYRRDAPVAAALHAPASPSTPLMSSRGRIVASRS